MPAPKAVDLQAVSEAFHSSTQFKKASQELGISPNRLRRLWIGEFGEEAMKARGLRHKKGATPEAVAEADEAFLSTEPFKNVAKRLGISPNTLRTRWVSAHGQEAFRARGKQLQQTGQARFAARTTGVAKAKNTVDVVCSGCSTVLILSRQQLSAYKNDILCEACRGLDTECPVCHLMVNGDRGLASHYRHQKEDTPHKEFLDVQEVERWSSQTEGVDYILCQECGFRGQALNNHLKLHNLSALEYITKYPGAPTMCGSSLVKKKVNARQFSYDLTREDLLKFIDEQGRVIVEAACEAYQCLSSTILRYCREYGLPSRNKLAWQRVVLDRAAQFLQTEYVWEWTDPRIRNPQSGRVLNFDGFFPNQGLIIEAHGDQHFTYSESWHGTYSRFEELRQRDAYKKQSAESLGFRVKVVRPSDPIYEDSFWTSLLNDDSVLWENKDFSERESLVETTLKRLRSNPWGFEEVPPRVAKSELTKLVGLDPHLDEDRCVRPYSTRGTTVCGAFFPHRYEAKHVGQKWSVKEAWEDDSMLRKAIRLQLDSGHPTTPMRVRRALVMFCRTPSVFRPAVAKHIYQTYSPKGGVVWDPCAGYGGRLMGAMAAGMGSYIGTDIEPQTVEGNICLAKALEVTHQCHVHQTRAEVFDPNCPLDLVFTSPPYFNLESYGDASVQAYEDYGDSLGWGAQFLRPVMKTAFRRLKSKGHLVLNLPSKPVQGVRLDILALGYAEELGFESIPPIYLPIRKIKARVLNREPILIWKKP